MRLEFVAVFFAPFLIYLCSSLKSGKVKQSLSLFGGFFIVSSPWCFYLIFNPPSNNFLSYGIFPLLFFLYLLLFFIFFLFERKYGPYDLFSSAHKKVLHGYLKVFVVLSLIFLTVLYFYLPDFRRISCVEATQVTLVFVVMGLLSQGGVIGLLIPLIAQYRDLQKKHFFFLLFFVSLFFSLFMIYWGNQLQQIYSLDSYGRFFSSFGSILNTSQARGLMVLVPLLLFLFGLMLKYSYSKRLAVFLNVIIISNLVITSVFFVYPRLSFIWNHPDFSYKEIRLSEGPKDNPNFFRKSYINYYKVFEKTDESYTVVLFSGIENHSGPAYQILYPREIIWNYGNVREIVAKVKNRKKVVFLINKEDKKTLEEIFEFIRPGWKVLYGV